MAEWLALECGVQGIGSHPARRHHLEFFSHRRAPQRFYCKSSFTAFPQPSLYFSIFCIFSFRQRELIIPQPNNYRVTQAHLHPVPLPIARVNQYHHAFIFFTGEHLFLRAIL